MQSFIKIPQTDTASNTPAETVIPDCCNIGIIFRVLLIVNASVFAAIIFRTGSLNAGLLEFVEASVLLELACLCSLLALCGIRNWTTPVPLWGQRFICAIVPSIVTAVIIHFFSRLEVMQAGFNSFTLLKGMLLAALFGGVLQHYFEIRNKAYSPALAEARLQALQARIRPHFLFNSLNAVLALIRSEPRQAETTLEDLADLFRVLLRDTRNITTLEEEIQLCQQYLSIEKIRLGERLQVEWEIVGLNDKFLQQIRIPALLLQPLLENAVHYGVEPASEPALIRIQIGRSIEKIEICIVNPYHNHIKSTGNQMALANIRERLALIYDVEAQLSTAVTQGLFTVHLRFPNIKTLS